MRILTSSKAQATIIGMVAVTVLAALGKLDSMTLTAILVLSGVYTGATAFEDGLKRKPAPAWSDDDLDG
jgi:hypothetical protein